MRTERFTGGLASADDIRRLAPPPADVAADVRAILAEVAEGGDAAVRRLSERFDRAGVAPAELRVDPVELDAAVATLEPAVLDALRKTITNVRTVAEASLREPQEVALDDGQTVELAEVPVRRAAAYVPGGRAAYPSTLVMCVVTAKAAGVEELAVCAPPGPEGRAHPTILAACVLCGVDEVYRVGGAQAIAALAFGTETVPPVDVIVGPGNRYVQEAKRQVYGRVGIDGIAGPSELVVVADASADPELVALDLAAQAEHGPDGLLALISPDAPLLDAVETALSELAGERASVTDATVALVEAADPDAALALAEELAPEHLELIVAGADALAAHVRCAGCVFIGPAAATAFGDYVAGSNHVLPTDGAARFAGALSPATFRRRMSRVRIDEVAASRLAPPGAALARAEGFPVHAESMERRARMEA